jgi:hypothetical protein
MKRITLEAFTYLVGGFLFAMAVVALVTVPT